MGGHLVKCTNLDNRENQAFLLKVTGNNSAFWLFLKVNQNCTLDSLDDFLRNIWLECCGHMSHFIINGTCYEKTPIDMSPDDKTMQVLARDVLYHKIRFSYEYDYGSTTKLRLDVTSIINDDDSSTAKPVLLARNNDIKIDCDSCQGTASLICEICMYEGGGFLCKSCVKNHKCEDCDDEPSFLPVLNSPRMGVCAYDG